MRLKWQCPTCYAQLEDKSYAKMLTCPYCGSLLIVNSKEQKFFRVPKGRSWYFFPKKDFPGYIKFGENEEIYLYKDSNWFLIRRDGTYVLAERNAEISGKIIESGEVEYVWGELPMVAPPGSTLKTAIDGDKIIKVAPRENLIFLKSSEKFPDIRMKLLKSSDVQEHMV